MKKLLSDVLVENQVKFDVGQPEDETKLRCEIIKQFCNKTVSPELFGVQPLTSSESELNYSEYSHKSENVAELVTKSCLIKTNKHSLKLAMNNRLHLVGKESEEFIIDSVADELALEIDRYNITKVLIGATTFGVCDFNNTIVESKSDRVNYLIYRISQLSNIISYDILFGGCNWVVASPKVSEIFETSQSFVANDTVCYNSLNIKCIGNINHRIKLYKDPLFNQDEILIGYNGANGLDNGYFFNPYVMFASHSSSNVLSDFHSGFVPNGKSFYARISLKNL